MAIGNLAMHLSPTNIYSDTRLGNVFVGDYDYSVFENIFYSISKKRLISNFTVQHQGSISGEKKIYPLSQRAD